LAQGGHGASTKAIVAAPHSFFSGAERGGFGYKLAAFIPRAAQRPVFSPERHWLAIGYR